jgi:dGTPase
MPSQDEEKNESSVDRTTQEILYKLAIATHHFVRKKTTALTKLKNTPDTKSNVRVLKPLQPDLDGQDRWKPNPWSPIYAKRLYTSSEPGYRGVDPHAKDLARILHSPSFRRLQGKSQLVPSGENEFFRTRLTHSLEVSEIATRIARRLNSQPGYFQKHKLNVELIACAALLHDIGHPPFGHSGEEALNEKMCGLGGFEGNAQTLRIVCHLENRLGRIENNDEEFSITRATNDPRGLNLTFGTLAGVLKYPVVSRGPTREDLKRGKVRLHKGYYAEETAVVNELKAALKLPKDRQLRTVECQIMDIADDIAYSAYDLEDTLEAGIVTPLDLLSIDDETLVKIHARVLESMSTLGTVVRITNESILEALSDAFATLVEIGDDSYDLKNHRRHRLAFIGRTYLESIEHAKNPLVRRQFLETLIESHVEGIGYDYDPDFPSLSNLTVDPYCLFRIECLKAFNFHKVITSRRLRMYHHRSKEIVSDLFDIFYHDKKGDLLSERLRKARQSLGDKPRLLARLVADHISSLTDSEAIRLHDQLKSSRNAPFTAYWR